MGQTIIVIPAEGDSTATEKWYVKSLRKHYGEDLNVLVYEHGKELNISYNVAMGIERFFRNHDVSSVEVHAQAGLGAYVAYRMLNMYPQRIRRVFFIGGAPSDAMTWLAQPFHCYGSRFWYRIRGIFPFFADDPNPWNSQIAELIRKSSTDFMRKNPKLYRNQLGFIGTWKVGRGWHVPRGCSAYFVPNGITVREPGRDNTFNNRKAAKIWAQHGVRTTARPGGNFSLYNMMPFKALFQVMDAVR